MISRFPGGGLGGRPVGPRTPATAPLVPPPWSRRYYVDMARDFDLHQSFHADLALGIDAVESSDL
ncbi:hypothetical protein ACIPMU_37125 [Streptomyces cyaneofuscatus]|uniref:hypothetical protein n=1 Tax=Streptomyces cyaneofuscatus TaxID=66883 RepID=UPI0037F8A42A